MEERPMLPRVCECYIKQHQLGENRTDLAHD